MCQVQGWGLGRMKVNKLHFLISRDWHVCWAVKEISSIGSVCLFSKCLLNASSLLSIPQWFSPGYYYHFELDSSLICGDGSHIAEPLASLAPAHNILVVM